MKQELFWAKVNKTKSCWFWTGALTEGYGRLNHGGKSYTAHKVAYELLVGPVPAGKELDHLCRVRHCVNPDHLEAVTHKENTRRGDRYKDGESKLNQRMNKKYLLYLHNERFRSEPKKSELVNKLLDAHYTPHKTSAVKPPPLKSVDKNKVEPATGELLYVANTPEDFEKLIVDVGQAAPTDSSMDITNTKAAIAAFNGKLCKNGHPIPEGRSKCLGKGCKYS